MGGPGGALGQPHTRLWPRTRSAAAAAGTSEIEQDPRTGAPSDL